MGLFDSVLVPCPECGTKTEAQSKSGDCLLGWYELEDAPADVLLDVNRHAPFTCRMCGNVFSVSEDDFNLTKRARKLIETVLQWEDDLSSQARETLEEALRVLSRL